MAGIFISCFPIFPPNMSGISGDGLYTALPPRGGCGAKLQRLNCSATCRGSVPLPSRSPIKVVRIESCIGEKYTLTERLRSELVEHFRRLPPSSEI